DSAYIAMNTVRVEIRNLDLVSRVIDTALTAGATNVASVSYWLSDPTTARRQAMVDAVRQARENAEAIAAAAGGSLGDLIELRTDPMRIMGRDGFMETDQGIAMARMQASVPTPVSPRDIDITAYVTARWKFVKGAR
ncbi:MAG: SIMPL domain-containing protein, partial [Gemmatimonadota bacterium]